jgi:hypothetical protein
MWCAKSYIENIYYVSKADTSNLSTHFRYRKLRFCVYFGIEIGIGSADTDLKSIGIGIELKILVSPITNANVNN